MNLTRYKILDLLSSALVAALLGMPLTMITAQTIGLGVSMMPVILFTLAAAILLSIASYSKRGAILSGLIALISLLLLHQQVLQYIGEFRALITGILGGEGEFALQEATWFLTYTIGFLFTVLVYWMSRIGGGFYPTLAVTIIVLLGGWIVDHTIQPTYVIPAVAGLVCQFSRTSDERMSYLKVLPVALIISALAFSMMPKQDYTWPPLQEYAERVRKLFYDYFMFTEKRTAYSLSMDGYLPLGDRLGGPANPRNEEIMEVASDRELMLRGAIKRTYTGYSWTDSNTVNSRYLFGDFLKRGTRDAIFDAGRAGTLGVSDLFPAARASVQMLSDATSTIFVPHRIGELSTPVELPGYYNTSGEVFTTRDLVTGDSYGFTAEIPVFDSKKMATAVEKGIQAADSNYASIVSSYTVLPRTIEQEVYDLTQEVIAGANTPYQTALSIQDYLMANYTYTLDVPYPPDKRDFVSNFLLSEKQGYCTYFASSMAVMCRIAGLPTRYIEGYSIPEKQGVQIITGQNAHAWVEVYFRGIGWLSFNPTPGQGDMNSERSGHDGQGNHDGEDGEGEEPDNPPEDDIEDETTDQEPGETPPPEDGENPEEQEPDDIVEDDPPPEEEPAIDEDDISGFTDPARAWIMWILAVIVILGVAGWIFVRIRLTDPRFRASEYKSFDDKLIVWYRAILLLYEQLGQVPESTETPAMFAERMRSLEMAGEPFEFVSDRLTISRYANNVRIEGATFRQTRVVYEGLKKQLRFRDKVRWYKVRILKGLGDFTHLP